jgi:predicted nucleic acid-binding protein
VADRRLVLDANILVRAVLGTRVRGLIERYAGPVDLLVPESAIAEVQEHLPTNLAKRRLPLEPAAEVLDRLGPFLQELPESLYAAQKESALARLSGSDVEDWPVLACALALECSIWTEDRDFFGTGVATWTSDRVEIFLRSTVPASEIHDGP